MSPAGKRPGGNACNLETMRQGLLVEATAEVPGGVAEGKKVLVPEVLHQQEPPLRIVAEDFGNRHADPPEKTGDRGIEVVLLAQSPVTHENEGIATGNGDAEVVAVRSAPPDGDEGHIANRG